MNYKYTTYMEAYPNPTIASTLELSQRMQLLGSLAVTAGVLLSEKQAKKMYGGARIEYMVERKLITKRKDVSSANGQYKFLKGDIDAVIFSNYHEGFNDLKAFVVTGKIK